MYKLTFLLLILFPMTVLGQDSNSVIKLWKDHVPGETEAKHPARETDDHSGDVIRLTDVTDPQMTVFKPQESNGAAVLICPGGGYSILAINHEGYEVATWLNELGFTAFVLEYRVPDKEKGALQDAQRAMRLIRQNAGLWNLDSTKIGVLGFSAGGSLSARLSTQYDSDLYPLTDEADKLIARPDFAVLIYPAYLDKGPQHSLTPELKIDSTTPPMFIFQTADDPYGNSSLVMAQSLREQQIPVELHLYPKGGHGYGLRENNPAGKVWPELAKKWLDERLRPQEH